MRRFTRLTNAFSKKFENHCHSLALYFFWYNWVRQHKTLGVTPAMAAGLVQTPVKFTDLLTAMDADEQNRLVEKRQALINESKQSSPPQSNCDTTVSIVLSAGYPPRVPFATPVARLETDEQTARRIADTLDGDGIAVDNAAVSLADMGGGRWRVAIHLVAAPDEAALRAMVAAAAGREAARALRFARLAGRDWVRESIAGLKPVAAGRFVVHGSHDRARVPGNRIGIEIEAALAFGTGHHGTTRGCLLALDTCAQIVEQAPSPSSLEVRAHGAPFER